MFLKIRYTGVNAGLAAGSHRGMYAPIANPSYAHDHHSSYAAG